MNVDRVLSSLGLPDDIVEVALSRTPAPEAAVRTRIRSLVLARERDRRQPHHSKSRRRWVVPLVVGIMLLTLIGPVTGYALLARFVPGFGNVPGPEVSEALAQAVHVAGHGYSVWVTGVLANASGTYVNLTVDQSFAAPSAATIGTSDGSVYRVTQYWWGGGSTSEGSLAFTPLRAPARRITLTLPFSPPLTVTLPLEPKSRLLGAGEFGPMARIQGVTLGARVEEAGGRTLVSILPEATPAGTSATSVGVVNHTPLLVLPDGRSIALRPSMSINSGSVSEFALPALPSGTHDVTVVVPSVTVQANGTTTYAQVPLPGRRDTHLSQPVPAAHGNVQITAVRRIGRNQLEVTFSSRGVEQLGLPGAITVNGLGVVASWTGTLTRAGALRTITFPISLPQRSMSLTLGMVSPSTVLIGPWRMRVPVSHTP